MATLVGIVIIFGALYFAALDTPEEGINDERDDEEVVNGENDEEIEAENGEEAEKVSDSFIECLEESGVVIYGSSVCPACADLEAEYGGREVIDSIYLDCQAGTEEEMKECEENMETGYVPEIQIEGEIFEDWGSPEALAEETGCEL